MTVSMSRIKESDQERKCKKVLSKTIPITEIRSDIVSEYCLKCQ